MSPPSPLAPDQTPDACASVPVAPAFRPGQGNVFQSLLGFFQSPDRSTYVKLPGSFGKTFLYVNLIRERQEPAKVLVPSVDLLRQARDEFAKFAPHLSVGFLRKDGTAPDTDVVLATVQRCLSLKKQGKLQSALRPLVIADEAHELLGKQRRTMIREMLQTVRVIGFTATDEYFESKRLSQLLGSPVHTMTFQEARDLRVIAPYRTEAIRVPVDLSNVRRTTGDYNREDLRSAMPAELTARAIAEFHKEYHSGEQGFVQCLGRDHADETARVLRESGVNAESITGKMGKRARRRMLEDFKAGKFELAVGAKLLIQGINHEGASVAYNFPSMSKLAVEQRGYRVLRLDPANPDKIGTVVEIITKRIPTRTPPLTFSEVVEGAISKGSVETGRKRGARSRPESAIDGVSFITDPDELLAAVRSLRHESGPWGRLSLQRIPRADLTKILEDIQRIWHDMLGECVRNKTFIDAVLAGKVTGLRPPSGRGKATLEGAAHFDWRKRGLSIEAEELTTDAVAVLDRNFDLSPGEIVRLFRLIALWSEDDFRSWSRLSMKNKELSALVQKIALAYEPLISGMAVATGAVSTLGGSTERESVLYGLGAEVLLRAIYRNNPAQRARFERFAEKRLAEAFQKHTEKDAERTVGLERLRHLPAENGAFDAMTARDARSAIHELFRNVLSDFRVSERGRIEDEYLEPMLARLAPRLPDEELPPISVPAGLRSRFERAVREHERLARLLPDDPSSFNLGAIDTPKVIVTPLGPASDLCHWLSYRGAAGPKSFSAPAWLTQPNDPRSLDALARSAALRLHPLYREAAERLVPQLRRDGPVSSNSLSAAEPFSPPEPSSSSEAAPSRDIGSAAIDREAMQCLSALVVQSGLSENGVGPISHRDALLFARHNLLDIPHAAFCAARIPCKGREGLEAFFTATYHRPAWWYLDSRHIEQLRTAANNLPVWLRDNYGAAFDNYHFGAPCDRESLLIPEMMSNANLPSSETAVWRALLVAILKDSDSADADIRAAAEAAAADPRLAEIVAAVPGYRKALDSINISKFGSIMGDSNKQKIVLFMKTLAMNRGWRELFVAHAACLRRPKSSPLFLCLSFLIHPRSIDHGGLVSENLLAHVRTFVEEQSKHGQLAKSFSKLKSLPWDAQEAQNVSAEDSD